MQVHWHSDAGDGVRTVQHAMAVLHVQDFDGENVRGLPKFLRGKEKWRGLMLHSCPPLHHRGDTRQPRRSQRAKNAENVQIGVRLVKIAARRRAVQNYRLEIIPRRFVQPLDQVLQRLMHIAHCVPQTLPAPRRPATSTPASAEAPKSPTAGAATEAAASPPAPHPTKHRSYPPVPPA